MTKQQLTYVFIALGLLLAGLAVWYFFFRDVCDPNNKGYTKKGKLSDKCFGKAEDPKTITTPPPAGCQWTPDNIFPLKRCMSGNKVKALQTALGFTGTAVDGRFGGDTENAVKAKFGVNEVSQPNYNSLINPPTTGGGNNFSDLKNALKGGYVDIVGGIRYPMAGENKKYKFEFYADNGRFVVSELDSTSYLKKGTYSKGGDKMVIDGGATYFEGPYKNMQNIIKTTIGD